MKLIGYLVSFKDIHGFKPKIFHLEENSCAKPSACSVRIIDNIGMHDNFYLK